VRDEITSLRGPDGSPSRPDVIGIPSRPAPTASHENLIAALERALREHRDDFGFNLALGQVERAIQHWRADNPAARPQPLLPLGRPSVLDGDVERLLALRAANPGSDCRLEFMRGTEASKPRARVRYRNADAKA
jgi:hypothetical protein